MLETHDLIIKLIKNSIYDADKAAFSFGKVTDFAIIPETFDDDCFGLLLEDGGCDIYFKVYYENEEADSFVTMSLYDELHSSVHIKFSFSDWENDFSEFRSVLVIVLNHYAFGNWLETMAEIEINGFGEFIDNHKSLNGESD
ncbi:TPA: hypothetical protein ACGOVY_000041 [Streptococcus suis]|nr:hypothetical protein [Streptococcus suis]